MQFYNRTLLKVGGSAKYCNSESNSNAFAVILHDHPSSLSLELVVLLRSVCSRLSVASILFCPSETILIFLLICCTVACSCSWLPLELLWPEVDTAGTQDCSVLLVLPLPAELKNALMGRCQLGVSRGHTGFPPPPPPQLLLLPPTFTFQ